MEGLVARDHYDLAADVAARVVGRPADADIDDLGLHATRPTVGEGLAGHLPGVATGDGEPHAVDDVERDVEVLERRVEPRRAKRGGDATSLRPPCGAPGRLGPELRAGAHLVVGDVGRGRWSGDGAGDGDGRQGGDATG